MDASAGTEPVNKTAVLRRPRAVTLFGIAPPERKPARAILFLLIFVVTGVTGAVLMMSAILRWNMEQRPRPAEWIGFGLGLSTSASALPQDPRIEIPLFSMVRLLIALLFVAVTGSLLGLS